MNDFFVGRQRELVQFINELSESDQFKDPSRIFYLQGESGLGKKTFYSELWRQLQSSSLDVIWVRPQNLNKMSAATDWSDLLVATMTTNRDSLESNLQSFKEAWAKLPKQAQALVGGGTFGNDLTDPRMRDWVELFNSTIASRASDNSKVRIVFALDDYDGLDVDKKIWFTKSVFEPLVSKIPEVDVRFLLSGRSSFYDTLDLESYWVPFHTEVEEMELMPFSPEETKEFARKAKVLLADDFDIHEKTGGIPAKVIELLLSGKPQEEGLLRIEDVENLFSKHTEEQRNWIMGAVHLQVFDEESLNIFGTTDGSKKALKWLQSHRKLHVSPHQTGYRVNSSWADAILRWQEQFNAEQYRKFAGRVEQFREVVEHIPQKEHRKLLAKLSSFNFFNTELLRKVFDENANELSVFIRNNLDYFIKTPFNYQISMQYQPFIHNYVRLIPVEDKQEVKERTAYIWGKKRESFDFDIEKFEEKLAGERNEFSSNGELLAPVVKQIKQREKLLRKSNRQGSRIAGKNKEGSNSNQPKALCMFLKLIGCVMVIFGIIILSLAYACYGVAFVLLGIYWPASKEEPKKSAPRRSIREKNADVDLEQDTLVGLLNLKRIGLENRSSFLSMNMAKYQRKLRELDTLINEPYI